MASNCIPGQPYSEISEVLSAISDSFMDLIKTIVYLDTSFNMLFDSNYLTAGYFGMYSVLNLVQVLAFLALNNQGAS
jgi:hypothetical protein